MNIINATYFVHDNHVALSVPDPGLNYTEKATSYLLHFAKGSHCVDIQVTTEGSDTLKMYTKIYKSLGKNLTKSCPKSDLLPLIRTMRTGIY